MAFQDNARLTHRSVNNLHSEKNNYGLKHRFFLAEALNVLFCTGRRTATQRDYSPAQSRQNYALGNMPNKPLFPGAAALRDCCPPH